MNNKNILLVIGIGLVIFGLIKPTLDINKPSPINEVTISEPSDPAIKQAAEDVVKLFVEKNGSKSEAASLRDLYISLARLVKLDGEDQVVKNTEEIKQANSLAGQMLNLDIKGKYVGLAKESQDVIVAAIGDDSVALTQDLRNKGSEAFMALAWAYGATLKQ